MIKIEPSVKLETRQTQYEMLSIIEDAARTCYKSENNITDGSSMRMYKNLIKSGHTAMIEHVCITVRVICDRGVSHEIVRHRIGSYAQESTRYCNYASGKFGEQLTFIDIGTGFMLDIDNPKDRMIYNTWLSAMKSAEEAYMQMIDIGATPQLARSVLPNSTKTELVMTLNPRSWLNFFKLRLDEHAHPQMIEVAVMIFDELNKAYPDMFNVDILELA